MTIVSSILYAIGGLVWLVLAFNGFYIFFFGLMARIIPAPRFPEADEYLRFVLFIPCYKGDEVILSTVKENLKVDYPKDRYRLVVIADSLKPETIDKLKTYPLEVVEVSFENSTKVKALRAAAAVIPTEDYDYASILDIDNVMARSFLKEMNKAAQAGCKVIQGQRTALNLDTTTAWLDGISEAMNNNIFRLGHVAVGLSSSLIGSGKAMPYDFYKETINELEAVGGFDKEMELLLLERKHSIHYVQDALVYDEKVQDASGFENQRRRWLGAQFYYLKRHWLPAIRQVGRKGNIDYLNKVLHNALLPRILVLGLGIILGLLSLVFPLYPGAIYWQVLMYAIIAAVLLLLPRWAFSRRLLEALIHIPVIFWRMLKAILSTRGANKKFIHTEHKVNKRGS